MVFDITEKDLGRYVRRKSNGAIGKVERDDNGWLHPGVVYEWRGYRDDLEYVDVIAAVPHPAITEDVLRFLVETEGMGNTARFLDALRRLWEAMMAHRLERIVEVSDALREYDRLSLVISSAVHWSDPAHDEVITAAILNGRKALGIPVPKKKKEKIAHEFTSDDGSEFCSVCGRSCLGHE